MLTTTQSEVIRCFWCGHRKDKWNQLCEACHRMPPANPPSELIVLPAYREKDPEYKIMDPTPEAEHYCRTGEDTRCNAI